MNFKTFLFFSCSLFALSLAYGAQPLAWDQIHPEIKQAVSYHSYLLENRLSTELTSKKTQGSLLIQVNLELKNQFHLYKDKMFFNVSQDNSFKEDWSIHVVQYPKVKRFFDIISKGLVDGFTDQSAFIIEAKLNKPIQYSLPSTYRLPIIVGFQACSDQKCLLPVRVLDHIPISQYNIGPATEQSAEFSLSTLESSLARKFKDSFQNQNSTSLLFVLFLAGILTALSPCVMPLYPLTLGLFSRWQSHFSASMLPLTLLYCAGITLSYAVIGLISVASGKVFGALTQTPLFLFGIGIFIAISALAFSGLFEFPLPQKVKDFFSKPISDSEAKQAPYSKAFTMGAGLGIVGSPCVGPVLVSILAALSTRFSSVDNQNLWQAYMTGFGLLACFGMGMSFPFLLIGVLSRSFHKKIVIGPFVRWSKYIGTTLMLATATYFIYTGYKTIRKSSMANHVTMPYAVTTLNESTVFTKWSVIDFRADWCAACLDLEMETFRHPKVAQLFISEQWEMFKVDLTKDDDISQKLSTKYNVIGLPSVLIVSPQGNICHESSLFGFEKANLFFERLQKATTSCR